MTLTIYMTLTMGREAPTHLRDGCSLARCAGPLGMSTSPSLCGCAAPWLGPQPFPTQHPWRGCSVISQDLTAMLQLHPFG